jgi:hypothetical protein
VLLLGGARAAGSSEISLFQWMLFGSGYRNAIDQVDSTG